MEIAEARERAAMYIRMSTERQVYSTEHQRIKLLEKATELGMAVVAEYVDGGKSGLTIKGRPQISRLLADALSGNANFSAVLVYDVSRWGRFQDVDESAHYEYICRHAGVRVIYCAEQFVNDGSPLSSLLKSIKRTMAAEYSRELSSKVFAAQCRLTELGFKQGGSAGYGLRRTLVDREGKVKRTLDFGDRKGDVTDRVIFALGPPHEVELVRRIYRLYVTKHLTQTAIALLLNTEEIPSEFGRPWTLWNVKGILTNEKYMGSVVFNRRSFKLKQAVVHNSSDQWVRQTGSFPAIITGAQFQRAQTERKFRLDRPTPAELLKGLSKVHSKHGAVNADLMAKEKLPGTKVYAKQFGSLGAAYALAGIPRTKFSVGAETRLAVATVYRRALTEVVNVIAKTAVISAPGRLKGQLILNGELILNIIAVRSRHQSGQMVWKIPILTAPPSNFVLCLQLDGTNKAVAGYFLLPTVDFVRPHITLGANGPVNLSKYHHTSLESIFGIGLVSDHHCEAPVLLSHGEPGSG